MVLVKIALTQLKLLNINFGQASTKKEKREVEEHKKNTY